MATNKNINECGWFYHAPSKKQPEETKPVDTPYISQIPGLNEYPEDEFATTPQQLYYKDTDTKFIRMAKQGGRKDLLVFREPKEPQKEAKGYPRVEWFYLEDNAIEDKEHEIPKEPHQFLLPDYMVHESYVPSFAEGAEVGCYGPGESGRVPYACDSQNIFQQEGKSATDKKVKIAEAKQPGYGVRNAKPMGKPPTQAGKPTTSKMPTKEKDRSVTKGDKHSDMHKILSYDYERQWLEDMKISTEKDGDKKPLGRREVKKVVNTAPAGLATKKDNSENSPFILSKFKNVQPRIDSHQPVQGKQPQAVSTAN